MESTEYKGVHFVMADGVGFRMILLLINLVLTL